MTTHTIGVIGVRDFKGSIYKNDTYIQECLELYIKQHAFTDYTITTGGGRGCESIIVSWALRNQVSLRKIPPNIAELGQRKAFLVRNSMIITQSDSMIFFWDGYVDVIEESIAAALNHRRKATIYPLI